MGVHRFILQTYDCSRHCDIILLATCGDGKRFGSEQCDDGNKVNGDGCSSTCTLESGYICPTPGSPCTSKLSLYVLS
jgi:cysteine-rich repeat protein